MTNENSQNKTIFERKIRPIFLYVGFIVTAIFSIAYFIVIFVMINGLECAPTIETFVGFLVTNLITGFCISMSMMVQGQDFAKDKPENKEILDRYYTKKETKLHSITYYWILNILKLIFTRLVTIAAMTYLVIDICWQGNGQYTYLLMSFFNMMMFLGFGMLGLVNMYDKYDKRYIPYIRRKLDEREKNKDSTEMVSMVDRARDDGLEIPIELSNSNDSSRN